MKNIIIYATKHGCAEKASKILKSGLDSQTILVDIMKEKAPALDEYDNVVLGGSIYMGKIQKELTAYINANLSSLLQKRVGLFICAGSPDLDARLKELEASFPPELYCNAISREVFGSELCFEKLNFFEKLIMRAVKGNKENSSDLSEEKIRSFASAMLCP